MRTRNRRRIQVEQVQEESPTTFGEAWSVDFTSEWLENRRLARIVGLLDVATRECLDCAHFSGHTGNFARRIALVSRRMFTREFKLSLCRELEEGKLTQGQACRHHALSGTLVRKSLSQYRAKGEDAFAGDDWRASTITPESRTRELEATLGRARLEIQLLKAALAKKPSPPRSGAK